MLPRITVKNAGPGSLAVLMGLWHRTWYAQVTPEAHHAYRIRLLTTPWARRNFQVLVLEENGAPRSGMIVITFPIRLNGVRLKVAGVAAVVTEPEHRRRGLAARLLTIAHRRLVDSGHDAALLFSDIGTAYYAKLGYVPWPLARHALAVPPAGAPSGLTVRAATAGDLPAMRRLYDRFQEPFAMALERPLAYWRHLNSRALWRDRMLGIPQAHSGRWIAERGGEPAGGRRAPASESERGPGRSPGKMPGSGSPASGELVAYARVVAREPDAAILDAAYLPGHAPALAHLVTGRARALDRNRLSLVAPGSLVEALALPVSGSEPLDKMMMAPLTGKAASAAAVQPVSHCFWPEDWF